MPTVALAACAMLAGVALLAFCITRTLHLVRDSVLARLPPLASQEVSLDEAGTLQLSVEHRRLDSSLTRAQFTLLDAAGQTVRSTSILVPTRVSGFERVRTQMRSFQVPAPGRYRLQVAGAAGDTSGSVLLLNRPYGAMLVVYILGMVAGGIGTIGGLVLGGLKLAGKLG